MSDMNTKNRPGEPLPNGTLATSQLVLDTESSDHTAIHIEGLERPTQNYRTIRLLHWPEYGIDIPWPAGMTPREAILAWARQQDQQLPRGGFF